MKKVLYFLVVCLITSVFMSGVAYSNTAIVRVKHNTGNFVSPEIIGTNLHVAFESELKTKPKFNQILKIDNNAIVFNETMVELCRKANIKLLRFPGGIVSDKYHWRNGVGSTPSRPLGRDDVDRSINNFFGTLEYAELCRHLKAQMIITVNYQTGTAQEAANWVEFCNGIAPDRPDTTWMVDSFSGDEKAPAGYFAWLRSQFGKHEPLNVKLWEIGNEIKFHNDSSYFKSVVTYSKLMKQVDPKIMIGISGDSFNYLWDLNFQFDGEKSYRFKLPVSSIDFISLHYYSSLRQSEFVTRFYTNGESERLLAIELPGTYKVIVNAHGDSVLGNPNMTLLVNNQVIGAANVSNDKDNYTFAVNLDPGINRLAIRYDNDLVVPGVGDRNLYITGVQLQHPNNIKKEIWVTRQDEYSILYGNNKSIEEHISSIRKYYPDLQLLITEGNAGYGINTNGIDKTESRKLKAALFVAGLMHSCIRNDIGVFAQWALYDTAYGFGLVFPEGFTTPTYDILKLMSFHAGNEILSNDVSGPSFDAPLHETTLLGKKQSDIPCLDIISSYSVKSKQIVISIVNRHSVSMVATDLVFENLRVKPDAKLLVLNSSTGKGLEDDNNSKSKNVKVIAKSISITKEILIEPHSFNIILVDESVI